MIYTRVLSSIFKSYKSNLSAEDYLDFENHVHNLMKNYLVEFSKFNDSFSRGKYIHQLIEKEVMASSHIATSCKKGCGACCHLEVEVTKDDAAVLYQAIKDGAFIDLNRLESLAQRNRQGEEWQQGAVATNRCLFLGVDDSCSVYESRPATCRKVAVVSDPKECADSLGKVVPLTMPMAEIIISASLNIPDNNFSSIPKQLHKIISTSDEKINANLQVFNSSITQGVSKPIS
jgi:Fe-S-cluster containining protein